MNGRLLLLCPGQGHQHLGMFDLARSSPAGAALLDELAPHLPPLDQAHLFANASAQPLIVAATLAMWRALYDDANPPAPPALVAGYSIGELSAYAVAGALAPADAVSLATRRAALMDGCRRTHPGQALLALSGLVVKELERLAAEHGYALSIETGDDSCIAGGPVAGSLGLQAAVAAVGGRAQVLPVEIASHTAYMAEAVVPFSQAVQDSALTAPPVPVMAGIDASPVADRTRAVTTLAQQLAQPIRWLGCMDAIAEAGVTTALELGPGGALSRMLQARQPHIRCRAVANFRSLDGVRHWLSRAD